MHACTHTVHSWRGATRTSSLPGTPVHKRGWGQEWNMLKTLNILNKIPSPLGAPLNLQSPVRTNVCWMDGWMDGRMDKLMDNNPRKTEEGCLNFQCHNKVLNELCTGPWLTHIHSLSLIDYHRILGRVLCAIHQVPHWPIVPCTSVCICLLFIKWD